LRRGIGKAKQGCAGAAGPTCRAVPPAARLSATAPVTAGISGDESTTVTSQNGNLTALLHRGLEVGASDLHLVSGYPPVCGFMAGWFPSATRC